MIDYCGLHVHSDYSLRDGFCKVSDIVKHCQENEYSACCITDHGGLGGAISLYLECNKVGIKPIVGCEFYVVDDRENLKESKKEHIVLLAKNLQGFKNLITINNDAVINGFYYKPTTDYNFIYHHSEGVICLTACAGGKASQLAIKNDLNGLCHFLNELKTVFGEDVYTEIMLIDFVYQSRDGDIKVSQQEINKRLVEASYRVGVKTVITNDSHYIEKGDAEIHDMVLMLSNNKTMKDKKNNDVWRFDVRDLYYKGIDDCYSDYDTKFVDSFSEDVLEDSLDSIEEIINKVERYKIDDSFKCPKASKNIDDALNKVTDICVARLNEIGKGSDDVYIGRLEKELDLMYRKNFLDYFLIVKDIIDYAKGIDVLSVGPGRGSCSGSLVCFLMGIVSIDCIKWNLPFERFLNYERSDSPDIDTDFQPNIRDKIKDYILKKYNGKSCSIGTYGKLKFKSTLLDICRIFNIPASEVFSITKKLPVDIDEFNFDEAVKQFKFLGNFLEKHKGFDIPKYFKKLYGSIRNVSKHAAGIIICNNSIGDQIPLSKSGEHFVSSWSDGNNKELSGLGFLKMDVLGLNAVKILSDCIKLIKVNQKINIELDSIDLTCEKTFRDINKIKLCGIFQFETPVSVQQIKRLKPKSIIELSNITAMIRPGPLRMGMDKIYLKNKINGYDVICSEIGEVLKDTYGIMLYQEQIMSIVQAIGGFTLGQADTVRRLLMKASKGNIKKAESNKEVVDVKTKFIKNASLKIGSLEANKLWDQMLSFVSYGFNRCLSGDSRIIVFKMDGSGKKYDIKIKELIKFKRMPMVLSYKDGRFVPCMVKKIMRNGVKEVFNITLRNKFSIKTTADHKFLTLSGWKELKDICVGDVVMTSKEKNNGSYNVSQKLRDIRRNTMTRLNKTKQFRDKASVTMKKTMKIRVESGKARDLLIKRHKEDPQWRIKSLSKGWKMIKEKWKLNYNEMYLEFRGRVKCGSPLQFELFTFFKPIYGNEKFKMTKIEDKKRNNFVLSLKTSYMVRVLNYDNADIEKVGSQICEAIRNKKLVLGEVNYFYNCDGFWNEVVSIEPCGKEETYDLSIDDNCHNYIANNFVVHNCHSIAYTIIAYWESWLKTHYPLEFYCALLNNVDTFKEGKGGGSKISNIVREMKQANIKIHLPDINISDAGFSIYNGGVMFGLQSIKGIVKASETLIKNRVYKDLGDLLNKNPKRIVNKKVVEALIGSGALNNIDGVVGDVKIDEVKYLGLMVTASIKNNTVNPSLLKYKGVSGKYSGFLVSIEEFKTKKNNQLMCRLIFEEIEEVVLVWPSDYIRLKSYLNKMIGTYFDFSIKKNNGDALIFVK